MASRTKAVRIEDQGHSSIAQNGGARHQIDMPVEPAQVFDHGLVISEDLVDDEAIASRFGFRNHDLLALGSFLFHVEIFPQPDIRNDFPAHVGDVLAMGLLNISLVSSMHSSVVASGSTK